VAASVDLSLLNPYSHNHGRHLISSMHQFRAFSDERGFTNQDGLPSFKIRRPRGSTGTGQPNNPRSSVGTGEGPKRFPLVRSHMIDLFPGNYEDDGGGMQSTDRRDDDEEYAGMEETMAMAEMHQQVLARQAQTQRWLDNSQPVVRVPVIDCVGRSYGRGARKTAQARVWITPGLGNVTVNRQDLVEYFPRYSDREMILSPLVVTNSCSKFDLQCVVKGGGLSGQAGAIRLGVARALYHWNPEYRPPMKRTGCLTRDARKVERKKIGRVKARKSPQWNRR